ncbi:MAG: hypothetical protein COA78_38125 [Blastopirellula sp.]|nr:MAG: hypothetical protein COA78_38125 [Blastopirellula sp.]
MAKISETISTVNSTIRTFLAMVIVAAVSIGSWFGYNVYHEGELKLEQTQFDLKEANASIVVLEKDLVLKEEEIDSLELRIKLLKVDRRVAHLEVTNQITDEASGKITTQIRFIEVTEEGDPIGQPRTFTIEGDMVYVDYWVVKFDDKYIEASDPFRATSICLFRRIFGEHQKPSNGFEIDALGSRPAIYGKSDELNEYEQTIWSDFWSFANDSEKAAKQGIRAAHGEAVSVKVKNGKTYKLELRSSDGLSIRPIEIAPLN